jgi:hypothetical protein
MLHWLAVPITSLHPLVHRKVPGENELMADTKATFHRIAFVKNFLTGPLAGLGVHQSVAYPEAECARIQSLLNEHTPDNPGKDLITGNLYWVSGIGCSEVAQ